MQFAHKVAGLLCFISIQAVAANFETTNIQVLRGFNYEPGDQHNTIITVEHANSWTYGDNYLFFDSTNPDDEQTGIYGEISPRLSFSKIFGNEYAYGPIKDILFAGTLEVGSNTRRYLYGLGVDIDVPCFTFVKLNFYKRDDQNVSGSTYQATLAWHMPLQYAEHKFEFEGFVDIAGSEGRLNSYQLVVPRFLIDVANYWDNAGTLYAGVEWQYWHHKAGGNDTESVPQLMVKWVF